MTDYKQMSFSFLNGEDIETESSDCIDAYFISNGAINTDSYFEYKGIKLIRGNMFDNSCLPSIPNATIDAIITDFPYGTLNKRNTWDKIIDYDRFWDEYHRICSETSPLITTAQMPFTAYLIPAPLLILNASVVTFTL